MSDWGFWGNLGSELSSVTMIPQMPVAADLTCTEDELCLKPGYAAGECHACRLKKTAE